MLQYIKWISSRCLVLLTFISQVEKSHLIFFKCAFFAFRFDELSHLNKFYSCYSEIDRLKLHRTLLPKRSCSSHLERLLVELPEADGVRLLCVSGRWARELQNYAEGPVRITISQLQGKKFSWVAYIAFELVRFSWSNANVLTLSAISVALRRRIEANVTYKSLDIDFEPFLSR